MHGEAFQTDGAPAFRITITRSELSLLVGGLREAMEEMDDAEFQTRVGVTKHASQQLKDQLLALLRQTPR